MEQWHVQHKTPVSSQAFVLLAHHFDLGAKPPSLTLRARRRRRLLHRLVQRLGGLGLGLGFFAEGHLELVHNLRVLPAQLVSPLLLLGKLLVELLLSMPCPHNSLHPVPRTTVPHPPCAQGWAIGRRGRRGLVRRVGLILQGSELRAERIALLLQDVALRFLVCCRVSVLLE